MRFLKYEKNNMTTINTMNNKALTAHDSFFTISVYRGIHRKSSEGDTKAGGAGEYWKKHLFVKSFTTLICRVLDPVFLPLSGYGSSF